MNKLKVFFNGSDISFEAENYILDDINLTLTSSDAIYVGYYKPINSLFLELKTKNTNTSKFTLKYFNGAFTDTTILDETKGALRSGFISWSRNLDKEVKTTVNGLELYWYKLTVDADTSALVIKGLNLVFSSDQDLKEEYPSIMDMLPEGETSFIGFHVASRKDIVSYFRTQGKLVNAKDNTKLVDQFDLLNYEEVRDASKFLTLAKILYWVSDARDDKWYQKAKDYEVKYDAKISLVNMSIDKNDDGKADSVEINAIQFTTIVRQ